MSAERTFERPNQYATTGRCYPRRKGQARLNKDRARIEFGEPKGRISKRRKGTRPMAGTITKRAA